jgi:hypothetical protein
MFRLSVEVANTDDDAPLEVDVQLEAFGVTLLGDDVDFELDFSDVPKLVGAAVKFVTDIFLKEE